MANSTRHAQELQQAVQAALNAMIPQIRNEIRAEFEANHPNPANQIPPPVPMHVWIERFNKQKPLSFEKAVIPADAENWISHLEKIFDVLDCADAFKARLACYKFEGDALAWWKTYKQANGGDAWVATLTWVQFKGLFYGQYFPLTEQQRPKRDYYSIRKREGENSTDFMHRFLRLVGFMGPAADPPEMQASHYRFSLHSELADRLQGIVCTTVAQVADAARGIELVHERDRLQELGHANKRFNFPTYHCLVNHYIFLCLTYCEYLSGLRMINPIRLLSRTPLGVTVSSMTVRVAISGRVTTITATGQKFHQNSYHLVRNIF